MACQHTFSHLLSRTSFANDGPLVQQAMTDAESRKFATAMQQVNQTAASAMHFSATLAGDVNLVAPPQQMPLPSAAEKRRPSDDGSRLEYFKPLLSEYGSYQHSHRKVYDSLIFFLGRRTFDADATPSDALALTVVVAWLFTLVEKAEFNSYVPSDVRQRAKFVSTLISLNEKAEKTMVSALNQVEEVKNDILVTYDMIISGVDPSSTVVTEVIWTAAASSIYSVLGDNLSSEILRWSTESFMDFVADVRGVPVKNGVGVSVTRKGEFAYRGDTYRIGGYCQEGIILRRVRKGAMAGAEVMSLTEMFCKTMSHYNPKGSQDTCAGCSARALSSDGRLFQYENSLIAADLKTAKDVVVKGDGSVAFLAESLIRDSRTGKILRTGYKDHTAQLYDLHLLCGFSQSVCRTLSCLFSTEAEGSISTVESEGVSVLATVERMDDYTVDSAGRVLSITHGSETKRATKISKLKWGDTATTSFTLDDIVT